MLAHLDGLELTTLAPVPQIRPPQKTGNSLHLQPLPKEVDEPKAEPAEEFFAHRWTAGRSAGGSCPRRDAAAADSTNPLRGFRNSRPGTPKQWDVLAAVIGLTPKGEYCSGTLIATVEGLVMKGYTR